MNYKTKEVKTVLLTKYILTITKEENRTLQKRGRNLEIKQYMKLILSEFFYNSILCLSKVYISVYTQPYL